MSLVLQSSSGGSVTLNEPATASNFTQTLPAADGVTMVSGNMPAFSAYASSGTSCSASTNTKILFQVENFDTNNNFASSTFTPTVAGYYQINTGVAIISALGLCYTMLWKNGSNYNVGTQLANNSGGVQSTVSSLIYMNGTTDYLEVYFWQNSGSTITTFASNNNNYSYFNGSLVRAA